MDVALDSGRRRGMMDVFILFLSRGLMLWWAEAPPLSRGALACPSHKIVLQILLENPPLAKADTVGAEVPALD